MREKDKAEDEASSELEVDDIEKGNKGGGAED